MDWQGRTSGVVYAVSRSYPLRLRGFIKNFVYETTPTTAEDMRHRIRVAIHQLQHSRMLVNATQEHCARRLRICMEQEGQHFEQSPTLIMFQYVPHFIFL